MFNKTGSFAWSRDIIQGVLLDRFDPSRRRNAELASTACRSLRFHSRAKIKQEPLRDILAAMGGDASRPVILPGPGEDLAGCGNQTAYHALGALVQCAGPAVIFETGTYLGVSALTMALNTPAQCVIYTLDLPPEADIETLDTLNKIDQEHVETSRYRVGEAFLRSPCKDRIRQIREDSMSFRAEKVMSDVGFAYIDGGHSLPLITKDTENAIRVLGKRGIIVWDDYFHLYPDVVTFLDNLSNRFPLKGIKGTNFVIYSPAWNGGISLEGTS